MFEWQIETNNIKKIEFAEVPTETGENGTEITMAFKENYYQTDICLDLVLGKH